MSKLESKINTFVHVTYITPLYSPIRVAKVQWGTVGVKWTLTEYSLQLVFLTSIIVSAITSSSSKVCSFSGSYIKIIILTSKESLHLV